MNTMYSPYANTMVNACKRHKDVHDARTTRAAAARKRGVNVTAFGWKKQRTKGDGHNNSLQKQEGYDQ